LDRRARAICQGTASQPKYHSGGEPNPYAISCSRLEFGSIECGTPLSQGGVVGGFHAAKFHSGRNRLRRQFDVS
jgi:hypothetical protein